MIKKVEMLFYAKTNAKLTKQTQSKAIKRKQTQKDDLANYLEPKEI